MAKKKINKKELADELMELMDVSAPCFIFDALDFSFGYYTPSSTKIENLMKGRYLWDYSKKQCLFDAIEENYGKRALEIIKILLSN